MTNPTFNIVGLFRTNTNQLYQVAEKWLSSLIGTFDLYGAHLNILILENNSRDTGEGKYWSRTFENYIQEKQLNCEQITVKYMYVDEPFNMNRFYNIGYAAMDPKPGFALFANSDLVFKPGWDHAIIQAFNEKPDAGTIIPASSARTYQFMELTEGGEKDHHAFRVSQAPRYELVEIDSIAGPGWLFCFKTETWAKLAPWNEDYKGWHQDWEIYERLAKAGYKSYVTYAGTIDHLEGMTFKSLKQEDLEKFKELTVGQTKQWEKDHA
jgi:hypothetical protein